MTCGNYKKYEMLKYIYIIELSLIVIRMVIYNHRNDKYRIRHISSFIQKKKKISNTRKLCSR